MWLTLNTLANLSNLVWWCRRITKEELSFILYKQWTALMPLLPLWYPNEPGGAVSKLQVTLTYWPVLDTSYVHLVQQQSNQRQRHQTNQQDRQWRHCRVSDFFCYSLKTSNSILTLLVRFMSNTWIWTTAAPTFLTSKLNACQLFSYIYISSRPTTVGSWTNFFFCFLTKLSCHF